MANYLIFSTYLFLYLSVIALWIPRKIKLPLWSIFLALSVMLGLCSNQLTLVALIPIMLLAITLYCSQISQFNKWLRVTAGMAVLLLSAGLMMRYFPGFHDYLMMDHVRISKDGIPFTLYLNLDKTIAGILILGLSLKLIGHTKDWLILFKQTIPRALVVILVLILLALSLQFVRFDPKLPQDMWIWVLTNLLFVCMAEEAFFRGFIQKNLALMLIKIQHGNYIAIFIASCLFGLAHYAGGAKYMLLATIAGMGYGWIYYRTKRIEASIVTHFGLNLTHLIFFTYPMLASAH